MKQQSILGDSKEGSEYLIFDDSGYLPYSLFHRKFSVHENEWREKARRLQDRRWRRIRHQLDAE